MAKLSLAEQLAIISDVTPVAEIDPEDQPEARTEIEDARAHYLDVESSSLRRSDALLDSSRYAGKSISRKHLLKDDEALGTDVDSAEEDEMEEEESSDPEKEGLKGSSDHADSQNNVNPLQASTTQPHAFEEEDRAMLQHLRQAANADVEKGRCVRRQLALWDTLLEGRIRFQKTLDILSLLPLPNDFSTFADANADDQNALQTQLSKLSQSLFDLRERLLSLNSSVQAPPRKKRKTGDVDFEGVLDDLKALDKASQPYLKATISKWSEKVAAASSANRFTDRNTWSQIESTLATDSERLVNRTRKLKSLVDAPDTAVEDVEVFDDGDFYQQLLKDVVESRSLDLDDGTLAALKLSNRDRSRKKSQVDTKASKGRKLRYHVHEKLVNFMAPQPQPVPEGGHAWHEDQINELFRELANLDQGFMPPKSRPQPQIPTGDNQLRIFA